MKDVVKNMLPLKLGVLFSFQFKGNWVNIDQIDKIKTPILFITGTKDKLVPSWMSHKLKEKATRCEKSGLMEIVGGKHNRLWVFDKEFFNKIKD